MVNKGKGSKGARKKPGKARGKSGRKTSSKRRG